MNIKDPRFATVSVWDISPDGFKLSTGLIHRDFGWQSHKTDAIFTQPNNNDHFSITMIVWKNTPVLEIIALLQSMTNSPLNSEVV